MKDNTSVMSRMFCRIVGHSALPFLEKGRNLIDAETSSA